MECTNGCEFQKFKKKKFYCTLYEGELICYKENSNVAVIRCKQCIEEKIEYEIAKKKLEEND
jgi:hypothetical protein